MANPISPSFLDKSDKFQELPNLKSSAIRGDSHPKCQPTIDYAICSAAGALPHFQRWFHPSEKLILTYPNHDAFEKMT